MRIPAFIHLPGEALDAPASGPWGAAMARWLGQATARLRLWHDEQRTLEEIERLDARLLRDIGVDGATLQARLEAEAGRQRSR